MRSVVLLAICLQVSVSRGQSQAVSIRGESNYKQWGWGALIMSNGIITHATVPAIGGRVMQYDIGPNPCIFVNAAEAGNTYLPSLNNNWPNFGGYKTWPAPQSAWNSGGWPPPPYLDYGAYSVVDTSSSDDSASVTISSQVEEWRAPGIQFLRKATIYRGTSGVKVEQTIVNHGSIAASWSVWDVTQSIAHHPGSSDYENYWSYFPLNPNSVYGKSGVSYARTSNAWKGTVVPGVYGVQFVPDNQKIFADPSDGWIVYANLSDSTVFARTFPVFEGAQYPDNGSRASVYVSGNDPAYMEIEVTGPLADLAAGGGSYTFTEQWWAAKVLAPVIYVDSVGAIAQRLSYDRVSRLMSAKYGVFYAGFAGVVFLNSNGQIVGEGAKHPITPLAEFDLSESIAVPDSAVKVEVSLFNSDGEFAGVLEEETVESLLTSVAQAAPPRAADFRLFPNYPNPFNPATTIGFQLPAGSFVRLTVYDVLGREVATLVSAYRSAGYHEVAFNASALPGGVYFCKLSSGNFVSVGKMILVK
jgi:Secretion system C-terminal sorting domain